MLQASIPTIIRDMQPRKPCWTLVLGILLLSACVAMGPPRESSSLRLIENVPFYPQKEFQCGPASLAGVLNYRGFGVTPKEIAGEIYSKSAGGTLTIDLVLYAQRKGMVAKQFRGNMDDLKINIDSGNPLIVMVGYGLWLYQANHFMVIVGYDERGVIVNSGSDRHKFLASDGFLRSWQKTNFWTLLVKGR